MDEWLTCQGKWSKSALYKRLRESSTTSHHGARLWLTWFEIRDKYKSESIANAIVEEKKKDDETFKTQTKPHPDLPGDEAR